MTADNLADESRLVKVIAAGARREYITHDEKALAIGSLFRRTVGMLECHGCRQDHVTEICELITDDMERDGDTPCERPH